MPLRKLGTLVAGLTVLAGLTVITTAATPAATGSANLAKNTVVQHMTRVRSSHFAPSPANTTEAPTKAFFTDDPAQIFATLGRGAAPRVSAQRGALKNAASPSSSTGPLPTQGSAQSVKGLNAFVLGSTHGFTVEPPDQGLCAGNGFVVEMVNLNLQVFGSNLQPKAAPMVLETFFGEPLSFGVQGGDVLVQGDPRCYYDAGTNRWFLSQLVVDFTAGSSLFQIAVSNSGNPMGNYTIYELDNTDRGNPNCPCLGDQPTMGANPDALFISTNEFGFQTGFNGSVIYTIDKAGLVSGASLVNTVIDFVGLTVPTPEWNSTTNCVSTNGLFCWASVRPTIAPDSGDRRFGGVEYLLSALDFANTHDSRIAVWSISNTSSIHSSSPSLVLNNSVMNSEPYIFPANFARQKAGPIPLGDSGRYSCQPIPCPHPTPEPEGMIQTNDDQIQSATYAAGLVWGGLNTILPAISTGHIGIGFFEVAPHLTSTGLTGTIAQQGYVIANGNDVEFPSIGVTSAGHGVMSFTLSGPNFFPTSAYAPMSTAGAGKVQIAALGQSPQDGATEYEFLNGGPGAGPYRPRWGDYSASVAVGSTVFFASEYIQFPNCSDAAFTADPTCGGTRSRSANWGTSLNKLHV